ncbi:MAG TPA: hypothetical protein VNJ07_10725 [Chitinophagales bacterium]|nr:hypothetical protein [Chitinophagales bacterium]
MKLFITILFIMAFTGYSNGQHSLAFCASVESNGYCYFNNTKFIAARDSATTRIFMQVKSDNLLGTSSITYKIYSVSKTGEEKMVYAVEQSIQPDWTLAWAPYNFNAGEKYNVKVYDASNRLLCAKSFELLKWF